ncbi:NfeD family protein [Vibrio sp.]|nr:NfeD family protein [Vibrio sp.]
MAEISPFLFFILLGSALVIAEVLFFNLTLLWLLIIGLSALVTSIYAWINPDVDWVASTGLFLGSSVVLSLLIYPILKKWQTQSNKMPGNDVIGQTVTVTKAVSAEHPGRVLWSGVEWDAILKEGSHDISVGKQANIVAVEGIRLIIE